VQKYSGISEIAIFVLGYFILSHPVDELSGLLLL